MSSEVRTDLASAALAGTDLAIRTRDLSKVYRIYRKPEHRLIQMATLGRIRPFREFAALNGVSLDIKHGETVGIVGRNGCGKSTLLQMICGTLQPTTGSLEVTGRVAALLELGAGFNPEFTGRDNVYINGAILGFSQAEMDERLDDILRFAAIGEFIDQPVKTYSSGMYVRLAFAVAISSEPDILVVDEALSVGDEAFQRKCFARIEQIKSRGATILFVSHAAQTVVQLCDRAILLDAGEKLLEGEPKIVVGQYQRLINASPEAAAAIRADIQALRDGYLLPGPGLPADAATDAAPEAETAADAETADVEIVGVDNPAEAADVETVGAGDEPVNVAEEEPADEEDGVADFFDPSLQSHSAVEMQGELAKIRDVRLVSASGKPVNVLRMGRRYAVEFTVDYMADVTDAGFAFGVRTPTGFLLSGASTFLVQDQRVPNITAGESRNIRFDFTCSLVPGIYFLLCGTRALVDYEETLLHRINDVACFRVANTDPTIITGHFDLNTTIRISES